MLLIIILDTKKRFTLRGGRRGLRVSKVSLILLCLEVNIIYFAFILQIFQIFFYFQMARH